MNIYDNIINKELSLLSSKKICCFDKKSTWENCSDKEFIFQSDISVDVGEPSLPSSYMVAFTSNKDLVSKNEINLIGKDISEIKGKSPYVRIAILLIKEEEKSEQDYYRFIRDIEYKRYKVNPKGVMVKVNTSQNRERLFISKEAVKKNISFLDIGSVFQEEYLKDKHVFAVKQYFITDGSYNYETQKELSLKTEGITVALDHIMKKLQMDCSTCNYKDLCDEIEGMRDIHKREEYKM